MSLKSPSPDNRGFSGRVEGRAEKGAALVVALLVVAMSTVMAVSLGAEFLLTLRRSGNALLAEQSYAYLRGGELLAIKALLEDSIQDQENQRQRDDLGEFWAQELPPYNLDDGWLLGKIGDLQGRLNLNALANRQQQGGQQPRYTSEQEQFIRLLQTFEEPRVTEDEAKAIVESVMDWLDADSEPNNFGAEDGHYLDQIPPYRTANRLFTSISELRAVANVSDAIYAAIAPHLMVWGDGSARLNIHTATNNVLRTFNARGDLSPLSLGDLDQLLSSQSDGGFEDIASFKELPVFDGMDMNDLWNQLVETTSYFLFTAEAEVAQKRVRLYSVLHRDKGQARVVSRSYLRPW